MFEIQITRLVLFMSTFWCVCSYIPLSETQSKMIMKSEVIIPGLKEQMMEDIQKRYWHKSVELMNKHLNSSTLAYKQVMRVTDKEDYPLQVAEIGYIELMQVMLENGLPVDTVYRYNYTILYKAAYYGHSDVVQLLILRGADVNVRDDVGYTPLLGAADDHSRHNVVYIQEKVDINGTETTVYITLHDASVQDSYPKTVQLLVESGADVNATNKYGDTPLLLAAKKGNLYVIQLLVGRNANVNAIDRNGDTPLHKAVKGWWQNLDVVRLLVNSGADVNATNRYGSTPLNLAAQEGSFNIVQLLVERGADINTADIRGYTPLHWAAREGNMNIVQLLVERGADINATNKRGHTPLHLAEIFGHESVAQWLRNNMGIS